MKECEIYGLNDFRRFVDMMNLQVVKEKFKPFVITIKTIKDHVSRQQQKYIFGVCYPHLRAQLIENGYEEVKNLSDEDFDYMLRGMFYFKTVITSQGEQHIPKRLRLGVANKDEVISYINSLLDFGARLGVLIPSPTDEWFLKGEVK